MVRVISCHDLGGGSWRTWFLHLTSEPWSLSASVGTLRGALRLRQRSMIGQHLALLHWILGSDYGCCDCGDAAAWAFSLCASSNSQEIHKNLDALWPDLAETNAVERICEYLRCHDVILWCQSCEGICLASKWFLPASSWTTSWNRRGPRCQRHGRNYILSRTKTLKKRKPHKIHFIHSSHKEIQDNTCTILYDMI